MTGRSALDVALVAIAQEDDQRGVALEDALSAAPPDFAEHLAGHGLAGLGLHRLQSLPGRFPRLAAQLSKARDLAWSGHLTMTADLAVISQALSGIPWVLVKGPVLAQLAYGRADLRSYMDLDVLVHPESYGEALTRLCGAGAELIDRNWPMIRNTMRGQLSLLINGRTPVDLHWHLINERVVRRQLDWSMPAMLQRSAIARIAGLQAPVLDDADAFTHLAVHACRSGAHRLVWMKDIERHLRAVKPDMALVRERSESTGLFPLVDLALRRAAHTFDIPLPWGPSPWSRVDHWLGGAEFRTSGGVVRTGRSLAEACRPSAMRSAVALAAAEAEVGRDRWARRRGYARKVPVYSSVEELRRVNGTPSDRREFLDAVAATA